MKTILQRLFSISIILVVVLQTVSASAPKILGVSVDATEEQKAVAYVQPSVVRILTTYCGKFKFLGELATLDVAKKEYDFCSGAKGSGFIVSNDGYIATNGHVVSFSEDDKLRTAFFSKDVISLYVDIITEIDSKETGKFYSSYDKKLIEEQIYADEETWKSAVIRMAQLYDEGYLDIESEDLEVFVQKPDAKFKFDDDAVFQNKEEHYAAELVALDYEEPIIDENGDIEFTSSDVAIIKVDADNLPAVKLGSIDELSSGSPILVLGFPGKADSPLVSEESESEATITQGIVSAIKEDSGGGRTLIQTDASIAHGNSGGPAIDKSGRVVGIATYVTIPETGSGDESGDFNFLRDVKDLIDLAEENDITLGQGNIDNLWTAGLDNFWQYKFTPALESLNQVKSLNSDHLLVQDYIDRANSGIENGEEYVEPEEKIFNVIPKDSLPLVIGGVVAICGGGLFLLFITSILRRMFKKKPQQEQQIPPMPQPTPQPQPSVQPLGMDPRPVATPAPAQSLDDYMKDNQPPKQAMQNMDNSNVDSISASKPVMPPNPGDTSNNTEPAQVAVPESSIDPASVASAAKPITPPPAGKEPKQETRKVPNLVDKQEDTVDLEPTSPVVEQVIPQVKPQPVVAEMSTDAEPKLGDKLLEDAKDIIPPSTAVVDTRTSSNWVGLDDQFEQQTEEVVQPESQPMKTIEETQQAGVDSLTAKDDNIPTQTSDDMDDNSATPINPGTAEDQNLTTKGKDTPQTDNQPKSTIPGDELTWEGVPANSNQSQQKPLNNRVPRERNRAPRRRDSGRREGVGRVTQDPLPPAASVSDTPEQATQSGGQPAAPGIQQNTTGNQSQPKTPVDESDLPDWLTSV